MSESTPSNTMRGRADESRIKLWLLLRIDRFVLTGGVMVAVFLALVGLSELSPTPMARVIESANALWWVFSPMVTALITVISLVVTFNQLVLSQELGALGDQRERMQAASAFRTDVEPWLEEEIAPSSPGEFLAALLASIEAIATDIATTTGDSSGDAHGQIHDFTEAVVEEAQSVGDRLHDAQFGTFDVIFASLNFNYSWKINESRRFRSELGDELDEETLDRLGDLVTVLEYFGPAREHFKTLYFQWELVNLSRAMLYTAVPAIVTAIGMLLYVDTTGITGLTLGVDNIVWLVAAAVTVTLMPFILLLSFVLRIATVAKRTLAMGPFILRETENSDE